MNDLFDKVLRVFGDLAMDKSLLWDVDVFRLPGFVAEHLAVKLSAEGLGDWLSKLKEVARNLFFDSSRRPLFRKFLVEKRRISIIDELRAWADAESGRYRGILQSVGESDVRVLGDVVDDNPMILGGGAWGLVDLEFSPETAKRSKDGKLVESPIVVVNFTPFIASVGDLQILKDARGEFTFEEWVNVLVNTLGFNHEAYQTMERKLALISRLLPLIEENLYTVEFGPKATLKSLVYKNVGRYVKLIRGTVSSEVLFYDPKKGLHGEVAVRDSIVFEDLAKSVFKEAKELASSIASFMASSLYDMGGGKAKSRCSMAFLVDAEFEGKNEYSIIESFVHAFPRPLMTLSFMENIHGVVRGWIIPKATPLGHYLSQGLGISLDYFSEALHSLRKLSLVNEVDRCLEIYGANTAIDEVAVKKLSSAFVKLLFPNLEFDREELKVVVSLAVEMRRKVNDWLCRTFPTSAVSSKLYFKVKA